MKPAVLVDGSEAGFGIVKIAADDPWPAHQQLTHRLAVVRPRSGIIVDDLQLHPERWSALLQSHPEPRIMIQAVMPGLEGGDSAEWTHFGHPPGVHQLDALAFERLHQRWWYRRPTADH